MNIKAGDVIKGPRWPEPVEVKLAEDIGAYVRIVGATLQSRTHIDQLISIDEIDKLSTDHSVSQFTADPRHVFLALETHRYRFA